MKQVTLSDNAIELLLVLLELNVESLSRAFQQRLSLEVAGASGRVPDQSDIRLAQELQLTVQLKEQLEKVKGLRPNENDPDEILTGF